MTPRYRYLGAQPCPKCRLSRPCQPYSAHSASPSGSTAITIATWPLLPAATAVSIGLLGLAPSVVAVALLLVAAGVSSSVFHPAAAALVEPFAPAAAGAISTIPHGSSSVVSLGYDRDDLARPLVGHGVLVPASEGLPISACTWSSEKWPGRAPEGSVLVRAFLPGLGPGLSDAELLAAMHEFFVRLGFDDLVIHLNNLGDPEDRARHLARTVSGQDENIARELESAARETRRRGSPEGAAELLRSSEGLLA